MNRTVLAWGTECKALLGWRNPYYLSVGPRSFVQCTLGVRYDRKDPWNLKCQEHSYQRYSVQNMGDCGY